MHLPAVPGSPWCYAAPGRRAGGTGRRGSCAPIACARRAEAARAASHDRPSPPFLSGCPQPPGRASAQPPARPGEVWRADITHVATREGWLHVAGVLDACSRRLVGWAADDTRPTALVGRAFERAIRRRRPSEGLPHHADRGGPYARRLPRAFAPPRRRAGHEPGGLPRRQRQEGRAFGPRSKANFIGDHVFATRAEAKTALFDSIEVFCKRRRLHRTLGFQSPVDDENNLSQKHPRTRTPTCPRKRGKITDRFAIDHMDSVTRRGRLGKLQPATA